MSAGLSTVAQLQRILIAASDIHLNRFCGLLRDGTPASALWQERGGITKLLYVLSLFLSLSFFLSLSIVHQSLYSPPSLCLPLSVPPSLSLSGKTQLIIA